MDLDVVEHVGKSLIQHGSLNNRIYVMDLSKQDYPAIISFLEKLAREKKYTKIFAKVPKWAENEFIANEFHPEAMIPGFYSGENDGLFLSKFLDEKRGKISRKEKEKLQRVLNMFYEKKKKKQTDTLSDKFMVKRIREKESSNLANLYKQVFQTYPFPIHSEDFIKKTMKDNVQYYGMYFKNTLIAAASAEMSNEYGFVEMTDFASLPQFRGKNLSFFLLQRMEQEMKKRLFKTCYTIARAHSFAMNSTFAKANYQYAGTLIHNTNIAGNIESMNVLFKKIE